jgi:antitoxin (DNA-binding transcriptional repressor) of toxin-antitoxin stability system
VIKVVNRVSRGELLVVTVQEVACVQYIPFLCREDELRNMK